MKNYKCIVLYLIPETEEMFKIKRMLLSVYINRWIILSKCEKVNRVSSKDRCVDCLARPKQRNTDLAQ